MGDICGRELCARALALCTFLHSRSGQAVHFSAQRSWEVPAGPASGSDGGAGEHRGQDVEEGEGRKPMALLEVREMLRRDPAAEEDGAVLRQRLLREAVGLTRLP